MTLVFGWTLDRKAERDDGVLVDIVREGGGWVENRDGKARVDRISWWGSGESSSWLILW